MKSIVPLASGKARILSIFQIAVISVNNEHRSRKLIFARGDRVELTPVIY